MYCLKLRPHVLLFLHMDLPGPFKEKIILSPLKCHSTFVNNQTSINTKVDFQTISSDNSSIFYSHANISLYNYGFRVSFEIRKFNFILLCQIGFGYCGSLHFHINLEFICQFLPKQKRTKKKNKKPPGIWIGLA